MVGFEGFFSTEELGLGFGDAGLDGEEVMGGGGAVLEREFAGVAGVAELGACGIAFLAVTGEGIGDFFNLGRGPIGGLSGVENLLLDMERALFLIEIGAGVCEGLSVGLYFVREVGPLFFGIVEFALGLIVDSPGEVAFELKLFGFADDVGVFLISRRSLPSCAFQIRVWPPGWPVAILWEA